jgi:hypothetical protein
MPKSSGNKRRSIAILAGLGVKSSQARSWWSIDVLDIENIQNDDPVFKKSSRLLLEDTYFLFGPADNNLNTGLNADTGKISNVDVFPQQWSSNNSSSALVDTDVFPQQWPSNNSSSVRVDKPRDSTAAAPTVDSPTLSPSKAYQSANGGCPPEHKLHRLWLYDSYGDARYGDGWGTTTLQIRDKSSSDILFEGTLDAQMGAIRYNVTDASMADEHIKEHDDRGRRLEDNSEGNAVYICLNENSCYIGEISGGTFTEECSWELTRVELETGDNIGLVAKGVGSGLGKCEFGLTDSCAHTCDGKFQSLLGLFLLLPKIHYGRTLIKRQSTAPIRTAGSTQTNPPTQSPTKVQPSKSPTMHPSGNPSASPTTYKTKRPTLPMLPNVLPQDILFGADEFNRIKDILLSASPTSGPALADPSSPQSQAFTWIYNQHNNDSSDEKMVQRWVLASFYFGTNGDNWIVKDGWLQPQSECSWHGVTCLNGVVSKLELGQNRLSGFIVPEIALWKNNLYVVSLGSEYDAPSDERNSFVMPLPSVLSELSYITFLNLENVGLVSSIPEGFFSNLSHLQSAYLNNNDITGTLPNSIKYLSSIKVLWLGGNNMDGTIISEIGNLTTLVDLSLESNFREDSSGNRGFVAALPSEIGRLTNLEILSLADNALSGQLPLQMGDLISLRQLDLRNNFFENQLPTNLGKLEMLEELDISHNW